ncbi:MAG: hydantoinase/oxoprolinase family protein, partial [Gemmatimonadota bacterium]|nr:hydantoinase/oxoprolinase family protein [Gemmatimonadota bacterium]
GGTIPVVRATKEPVHTVLSGPAGGVVGALEWSRRSGHERIITFDMGGTSTDVSLCPGSPMRTREFQVDGIPVSVPVIDIHTVGAGGGSLARMDSGGALRVGPESAGAVPGPICYGRGGTGVTVTDAHVWLGRLPADAFLGGNALLDREAVRPSLSALADSMGTSPEAVAEGILSVADAAMERALRVISVERGHDPRDFSLVAFGGAGGLHVAKLAERIGAPRAIIPPNPGLLSAFGMLVAPATKEASRSAFLRSDRDWASGMAALTKDLAAQARNALREDGYSDDVIRLSTSVDARYLGQSFELQVPADDWESAFHRLHKDRYGYDKPGSPVEAVTVRVIAEAPPLEVSTPGLPERSASTPVMVPAWPSSGPREVPLYQRDSLGRGARVMGPAIIAEYSGTTWIPAGWQAEADVIGSLHLTERHPSR